MQNRNPVKSFVKRTCEKTLTCLSIAYNEAISDSTFNEITGKVLIIMRKITIMNTDLELSPMGMGCVNAGIKWDGEDAFWIFDAFLDMGGTVYDTARVYSDWIPSEIGRSERVLGQWLRQSGKRHDIVLLPRAVIRI